MKQETINLLERSIIHAERICEYSPFRVDWFQNTIYPLEELATNNDVSPFLMALNNYQFTRQSDQADVIRTYLVDEVLDPSSIVNSLATLELYLSDDELKEFYTDNLRMKEHSILSAAVSFALLATPLPNAPFAAFGYAMLCAYLHHRGKSSHQKELQEHAPYSHVPTDLREELRSNKSLLIEALRDPSFNISQKP